MNYRKHNFRRAAIASIMLAWSMSGVARGSHFVPGMMNVRDFLAPEKEGVYAALYLGNYSTDKLKDKNGNIIDTATFQASKSLGPGIPAGAAIGAIAGDAGKGVAIGATAGGIRGGFKRMDQNRAAQSQAVQLAPGQDACNRAIKPRLSGRNYSVN